MAFDLEICGCKDNISQKRFRHDPGGPEQKEKPFINKIQTTAIIFLFGL